MAEPEITKQPLLSQVRDYMTSDPQTLGMKSTLLDAVLLLRRSELRHIPILDNDRLVGVLSDRDVARWAPSMATSVSPQEYNRVFEETPVSKVMTRNPISVSPDAPLAEAVNLMYKHRLGCLPVLEAGRLSGIITVTDMLRALYDLIGSPQEAESV